MPHKQIESPDGNKLVMHDFSSIVENEKKKNKTETKQIQHKLIKSTAQQKTHPK